jgi:hypothetical protein
VPEIHISGTLAGDDGAALLVPRRAFSCRRRRRQRTRATLEGGAAAGRSFPPDVNLRHHPLVLVVEDVAVQDKVA